MDFWKSLGGALLLPLALVGCSGPNRVELSEHTVATFDLRAPAATAWGDRTGDGVSDFVIHETSAELPSECDGGAGSLARGVGPIDSTLETESIRWTLAPENCRQFLSPVVLPAHPDFPGGLGGFVTFGTRVWSPPTTSEVFAVNWEGWSSAADPVIATYTTEIDESIRLLGAAVVRTENGHPMVLVLMGANEGGAERIVVVDPLELDEASGKEVEETIDLRSATDVAVPPRLLSAPELPVALIHWPSSGRLVRIELVGDTRLVDEVELPLETDGAGTFLYMRGDLTGDGLPDFIQPDGTEFRVLEGTALGTPGETVASLDFWMGIPDTADLDGDGVDDLLLGVPEAKVGAYRDAGAIYVFRGPVIGMGLGESDADALLWEKPAGRPTPRPVSLSGPGWVIDVINIQEPSPGDYVKGVGDVTGDGNEDVAVGTVSFGPQTVVPGGEWMFR